jgi:cytochrome c peroxidase
LLLPFNTPTVFNAALNFRLNWEGNVRSLEREAEEGLRNPAIMASSAEQALVKISADEVMTQRFRVTYGRAPDVPAQSTDAAAAGSILLPASYVNDKTARSLSEK